MEKVGNGSFDEVNAGPRLESVTQGQNSAPVCGFPDLTGMTLQEVVDNPDLHEVMVGLVALLRTRRSVQQGWNNYID